MTDVQAKRAERLRALMDEHGCWPRAHPNGPKYADYDGAYQDLAEYLGVFVNLDGEEEQLDGEGSAIPRYAALRHDETYGMIDLCETLADAIGMESGGVGEEYLMNPGGIVDLDTGETIATRTVGMTAEAFTVLCGLVQPSWLTSEDPGAVNHAGIYSEAWEELRRTFPLEHFRRVAQERGEDFYHEEAGL